MATAKYYEMDGVHKVFVVRDRLHTYYVQEMPGMWGCGRNYAIMKDRKRLYYGRMDTAENAKRWLLQYLLRELEAMTLDL